MSVQRQINQSNLVAEAIDTKKSNTILINYTKQLKVIVMGKRSKYSSKDKLYALSILDRFNGSFKHAAAYLNEEGRIKVTSRTLQNWNNERDSLLDTSENEALLSQTLSLEELSPEEIRSEAIKGLEAVVKRITERLVEDRFNKLLTSYELVNIGSFFASLSEQVRSEQPKPNIYQQIINQTYNKTGKS